MKRLSDWQIVRRHTIPVVVDSTSSLFFYLVLYWPIERTIYTSTNSRPKTFNWDRSAVWAKSMQASKENFSRDLISYKGWLQLPIAWLKWDKWCSKNSLNTNRSMRILKFRSGQHTATRSSVFTFRQSNSYHTPRFRPFPKLWPFPWLQ